MKFTNTEEILAANTKAQRNLKSVDLKKWYTQEELALLCKKRFTYASAADLYANDKFYKSFYEAKAVAKTKGYLHRWTPKEDAFLLATYAYLTDTTIGLALNLPVAVIHGRRSVLKLRRKVRVALEVIVWCKRDSFEADCAKEQLTKARPSVMDNIEKLKDVSDDRRR